MKKYRKLTIQQGTVTDTTGYSRSKFNSHTVAAFLPNPATYLCLCLLLNFAVPVGAQQTADTIFTNGKIVTVDGDFSIIEAMAVQGERIIATGTTQDIEKLSGSDTEKIDLQGATVLPGLIDSHVHATGASMYEAEHKVPYFETISDVLKYIKKRAREAKEGEWVQMSQVFITRLRERRYPTRKEMDKVAPNTPVVFRTGPDAVGNSMALKLSGIDENYKLPEGSNKKLERDQETGELTGIIRNAGGMFKMPPRTSSPSFEFRTERLAKLFKDYNSVGITGVSDRAASDGGIRHYQQLLKEDRLTCRVYLYRGLSLGGSLQDIEKRLDSYAAHPLHEYNNKLWLRGVKIFLDGGMLTGSAYMLEPWGVSEGYGITDPEYRGVLRSDPDQVFLGAKAALERGLQFTAHAVGDGAVETLVNAYTRIAEEHFPVHDKRPCVTHCNFMSADAINKMAKHGIVCDLQPAWLYLDGSTLNHHFGHERLTWFQPYKTLFDKGVMVGGGSDHMQKIGSLRSVNPYNPFLGMWTALTRQPRWMDKPLHPEQKITREQVIRLYTINNAYLTFEEKEKGSLESGKLADFIILDRDILECPLDEVRDIKVKQTWLGGEPVYDRDAPFTVSEFTKSGLFTGGIEGPACDRDGNLFAVSFEDKRNIGRVTPEGRAEKWIELPEGSTGNGIRFNRAGEMFVADYTGHNILKIDPETKNIEVFAHQPEMHQPNDLAIAADGTLYASDPDWKNGDGALWRISTDGKVTQLADGKGTTNGIEVSPDGKILYVAESKQRRVLAYDLDSEGIANERTILEFPDFGLDGMRCDAEGNLYITRHGAGVILKASPEGEIFRTIELPGSMPSNLCFGGEDGKTVYVTEVENQQVLRFRVDVPGLSWMRWRD
ncbi:MAG: amidohydrolase family protein [Verrucomicrobiales bacterium]|nr:amidohydrolase family protein [Verrucomicrobiales bacterium]